MTSYTAVLGTWGLDAQPPKDWFRPTSRFAQALRKLGLRPLRREAFIWSGDINGAQGWRRWFKWLPFVNVAGDYNDWRAGGASLRWFLKGTAYRDRALIAHSHGGWVALHACAGGLKIPVLFTLGTPIRRDLDTVISKARPNIGFWVHFYDPQSDAMQRLGAAGDGHIDWCTPDRVFKEANLRISHRFGHSQLLNNPACYELWHTQGWADLLIKLAAEPLHDQSSSDKSRPAA